MTAIALSPIYILIIIFLARRLYVYLKILHPVFGMKSVRAVYIICCALAGLSIPAGFFWPGGRIRRILCLAGDYWLGILLYTVIVVAVITAFHQVVWHVKALRPDFWRKPAVERVVGGTGIAVIVLLCVLAVSSAVTLKTTRYDINADKHIQGEKKLRVCLIADLHMGYNIGCDYIQKMAERVNSLHPDIIVIAGDIFDNDYDALEDPHMLALSLSSMKSRYGTYACYGNHDVDEKILGGFTFTGRKDRAAADPRMDCLLESAGITLLQDQPVLVDGRFYVVGRRDYEKPGSTGGRKSPGQLLSGLDQSKPILVLDHEPRELEELEKAGADVDFCGHTHDGQTFPGNLTIKLFWENPCGHMSVGDMDSIVTSGVGVFGPRMRLGTRSEVCCVDVHFQ